MNELACIRKYWNKPDPPTFCSTCRKKVTLSPGPMPGLSAAHPCKHCGSHAGWTSTFMTGGRDAKADIQLLFAELDRLKSASRTPDHTGESSS